MNLTERASQGLLDPLIGRTDELQRTIEVLCRRRKNNPVFVGDPGVGKTALAEGLATRLLNDDVQGALAGAEVFSLDTGALLAGTRFRGDFEERFKAVVNALSARRKPILFIDEMHSTVGAGAVTGGTMDLATMLKPLLTAGSPARHRIDDARGVQAHRKGPGARPASPEDRGRGTVDRRRRSASSPACAAATKSITACATPMPRSKRRPSWRRAICATTSLPDSAIDLLDEAGSVTRLQALAAAAEVAKVQADASATGSVGSVRAGRRPRRWERSRARRRRPTLQTATTFRQLDPVRPLAPRS